MATFSNIRLFRQGIRRVRAWSWLSILLFLVFFQGSLRSQVVFAAPDSFEVEQATSQVVEGAPAPTALAQNGPPNQPPNGETNKAPGGEKPKDGTGEKKEGDKIEPVKRPTEPPAPPDKRELDIKPDDDGMVQFQFRNQAWPDVLKWLAETSSMSLDWQELPGDYLNLATRRPHTIEETRDLFNRHLLARGYTLLEIEGVLQVVKTEKINPALVPKVDPKELGSLPPNRFVRVSIPLESLIAEDVVDEFKLLISTNGKLVPLPATNRLEAMDAAANLKELYRIVGDEQSESARSQLAREFVLKYVRASDVKSQLEIFLGLQKASSGSSGGDPGRQMQQMQEMMQQQMQQQMQQMQQRGGDGKSADKSKQQRPKEVFLVANPRQNSVIVHAQPDKMAIVEAFVKRIDVPNENADDLTMLQSRMHVFRLASLSPKQLVASLLAMDALEPTTRLEVDEQNKAVIAYASLADQYAIQKVVERLDGSARNFDMIQLKRLKADEVAGTVKFLMGTDKEKKDDSNSRRYFYFDPYNRNDSEKKEEDAFRVGANVDDNQLLLWCNEKERKEVVNLLIKLGELPAEGVRPSPFRTIDASRSHETLEYLRQLQEKWKTISPNPLILPNEDQFDKPEPPKPPLEPEKKSSDVPTARATIEPDVKAVSLEDSEDRNRSGWLVRADDGSTSSGDAVNPATESTNSTKPRLAALPEQPNKILGPPIEIRFDSQGNLLLYCDDLEALDRLEMLMLRDAPPKRPYEVFHVQHTRASFIAYNLEDYFKLDSKSKNESSRYTYYFFDAPPPDKKKDEPQLGERRELKFIWDNDTSTIVAIGASDAQRKLIKELIELWDTPDPKRAKNARYQRLVQVQFSKAEVIEQAIKDAYRDFLTENDKTFDRNSEDGKKGGEKRDRSESDRKFSMGVDTVTNIIIVSAEGEDLLNVLCDIIKQLDVAAKPSGSLEVVQFETGGSSKSMEKAFKALMESAKKSNPQDNKQRGQNNNQNNEPDNGQVKNN